MATWASALQWVSKLLRNYAEKEHPLGYISNVRVSTCTKCKALTADDICKNCKAPREWITIESMLGGHQRNPAYAPELTTEILANIEKTAGRVNLLLKRVLPALPDFVVQVNSGWRPVEYNKAIGGAASSRHCVGLAVDLNDPKGQLCKYLEQNEALLVELDLAIEAPSATPGWTHVQCGAAKSGKRVFLP